MKKQLVNFLARHFYPQTIFVACIKKFINKNNQALLVDAPCGNGETTWGFSARKNLNVFGYDIDERSIHTAKLRFKENNLQFMVNDIFNVIDHHKNVDYFCIINSLFLLPNPDLIIKNAKHCLKKDGILFVIIPNVDGKNFKWFRSTNTETNKLILKKEEVASYFNSLGLNVSKIIPIVFAHNYGRKDIKLLSVFSHFYLQIINYFQTLFKIGQPNYFLLVIRK